MKFKPVLISKVAWVFSAFVISVLVGCVTVESKEKKIAEDSCEAILDTGHHAIALRTSMINDARKKLQLGSYTKGDELLLYALENNLCEQLILDEAAVEAQLTERLSLYAQYNSLMEEYLAVGQFPDPVLKQEIRAVQKKLFKGGAEYGKHIYEANCLACHASGVTGAPKIGELKNWAPRMTKNLMSFYDNVINGHSVMPSRGFCEDCSDEELKEAVNYMLLSI